MPDVSRATPEVERALGPALAEVAVWHQLRRELGPIWRGDDWLVTALFCARGVALPGLPDADPAWKARAWEPMVAAAATGDRAELVELIPGRPFLQGAHGQRADVQPTFIALGHALGVDGWRVFAARMVRQAPGERERHVQPAWGWAGLAGAELVIYGAPVMREAERPT